MATGCRSATIPPLHNLSGPATAGLFVSAPPSRVNNPLFTLHRMFTLYHYESINKKPKVNSVNS